MNFHVGHRGDRLIDVVVDLENLLPAFARQHHRAAVLTVGGALRRIDLAELVVTDRRVGCTGDDHVGRKRQRRFDQTAGEKDRNRDHLGDCLEHDCLPVVVRQWHRRFYRSRTCELKTSTNESRIRIKQE
ncbi:hypothetical protein D9M68_696870 [compost metagenome]